MKCAESLHAEDVALSSQGKTLGKGQSKQKPGKRHGYGTDSYFLCLLKKYSNGIITLLIGL